jgi:hypothetical protein
VYESRQTPPVQPRHFYRRMALHFLAASALIAGSLLFGMWGYAHFEGLDARDAFLNASMILGGMGPVEVLRTPGGKLFAGFYALYSGLVFLVAVGIILAPAVHRALHTFHWDADQTGS